MALHCNSWCDMWTAGHFEPIQLCRMSASVIILLSASICSHFLHKFNWHISSHCFCLEKPTTFWSRWQDLRVSNQSNPVRLPTTKIYQCPRGVPRNRSMRAYCMNIKMSNLSSQKKDGSNGFKTWGNEMSSKADLSFLCMKYKSFNFTIMVRIYSQSVFFIQAICVAARQKPLKSQFLEIKEKRLKYH